MSAPTKPSTARRPAPAKGKSRVTQYVDQQLEKTRRQVKSTDLIASILLLVVMVIGFLLLAAFVDAWVFTLTPLMRWAALLSLVTGCVVMMVFSIWPLLTKKINPDYAAKMLEDAKPGFRNSLLNYVWFRKKPDAIGGAVFDAVARQAAVDLNSVPDTSTVDRSKVIRLGFWLVGVTAAMIMYFILSPKNPLQTFNRVMFPSADLAKPAVVTIADVTPGNALVFFGDQVEITAKVYGPHSPEQVQLIYSTNDGRQSGQVRIMQPDPATPRQYKLNLTENTGGLRESLEYEIVARDGQSGKFEIKVAPRPAITIESVQVDPPKYTKLKSQTTLQGAIDGVEGARVTVRATANLEIDHATIELLNQLPTLPGEDQKFKLARTPKKMTVDSKNAKTTFQLQLDTNREKPIATHYRLNFRSVDGESPAAPNIYPIRIIPDLAPELEVRSPVDAESKVPANGTLNVAAVANDVDYKMSFVRIHVEHRGNQILSKPMSLKTPTDKRQVQARYVIRPEELGLTVGDQATFYITAGDNRTAYFSDAEPAPNLNRSKNYSFTVVEPNTPKDGQRTKGSESNPPTEENNPADDAKDSKKEQSESGDGGESSDEGAGGSQENNDSGDGGESEEQSQSGDPAGENSPSDQPKPDGTGEQSDGSGGSGDSETNEPNPSESQGDGASDSEPSGDSEGGEPEESEAGGTGGAEQGSDQESTDGNGGSETDTDGGDPANRSDGAGGDQQPSDPDSGADASNARSGNDPSGDNTVSDSAAERKDDSLTEGEQELSKDASEAEQVRQLEKLLSDNPDKQKQEGDPNQAGDQGGGDGSENQGSEEGPDPSNDQKQNPNDRSTDPQRQNEDPSKPGGQAGSESEPQGAGDQRQDPQKGDPQSGSSEQDPSGNSAQENPANPNEDSASSESNPTESGEPDAGTKGEESEQQNPSGKPGEKGSGDSPSEQPGGGDQPKPDGAPSESGKPSDSPSGQGPEGEKPSGEAGDKPSESPSSGEASESGEPGKPGKSGGPSKGAKPGEAENPEGGKQAGKGDVGSDVLQREKENLEYSKKTIDLLLDKLRSQRHNPDKELLKKMGWDKQQLNDFVDSWDEMEAAAEQGDARAKRQLDRRRKATGLTPDGGRRSVAGNQQEAGALNQDGVVNEAPPNEFHNFNTFLQDFQRAKP